MKSNLIAMPTPSTSKPASLDEEERIMKTAYALWNEGKQRQAMNLLSNSFGDMAQLGIKPSVNLASWLIEFGDHEPAAAMAYDDPVMRNLWNYTNALKHFCSRGDTAVSRAALFHAHHRNPETALQLMQYAQTNSTSTPSNLLLKFSLSEYTSTPGFVEWVAKVMADGMDNLDGSKSTILSFPATATKFKRWHHHFSLANFFIGRNNLKNARKHAKSALKEAVGIDHAWGPFCATLMVWLGLFDRVGDYASETIATVETRLVTGFVPDTQPLRRALILLHIARFFNNVSRYARATELLQESSKIMDQQLSKGNPHVNTDVTAGVARSLGYSLAHRGLYAEAVEQFRKCLNLREQFLGKYHPELCLELDQMMRCLHHAGKHEEEASVRTRLTLFGYDPNRNLNVKRGHQSPWNMPVCQAQPGLKPNPSILNTHEDFEKILQTAES